MSALYHKQLDAMQVNTTFTICITSSEVIMKTRFYSKFEIFKILKILIYAFHFMLEVRWLGFSPLLAIKGQKSNRILQSKNVGVLSSNLNLNSK